MKKLIALAVAAGVLTYAATIYPNPDRPGSPVTIKMQAVPTSTTVVAIVDAYVEQIYVSNPTAGALTFTLTDAQGTPQEIVPTISLAANTSQLIVFPFRIWCPGGFKVLAGGSGLKFSATWRQ